MLSNFDIEFITEMFLDNDSTSTLNRLTVAVADTVVENSENIDMLTDLLYKEHPHSLPTYNSPVARKRRKVYYDETVQNFTDEEFFEKFKIKRSTAEVSNIFFSVAIST
uniref:Uncharacterized protein n=1 Tax=Pectinophora gossypiella TaxID=13191 RepID=A0A1E1WUP1_PECGO